MPVQVSIVVPTFNRASMLSECIQAILNQSFSDFELIIVNDGSYDNTLEVLSLFDDKRLKIISQENKGVSAARNTGILSAQGEYLAFCDSDDLWDSKKLETQVKFFQQYPEAIVCYTDEIWIRNGQRINQCNHHKKLSGWIFEKCLELCIVSPSSVMMKKVFFEKVGNFDESLPACEDYDLWLRASLVIPFHFIPKPLIIKRGGHEDQLSKKYWGMDRFRVISILRCLEKPLSLEQRRKAVEILCQKCSVLAKGALKRGRKEEAMYYQKIIEEHSRNKEEERIFGR